jgi:hypothetical protein
LLFSAISIAGWVRRWRTLETGDYSVQCRRRATTESRRVPKTSGVDTDALATQRERSVRAGW